MAVLAPGIRDQSHLDDVVHFDGTVTTGGTAQLLLPQQPGRTFLAITNLAAADTLFVGFGPARATPSLSGGSIASIAVTQGGVGYTVPPQVVIMGGIVAGDYVTTPGSSKSNITSQSYLGTLATAVATLSSGAVNAINVSNPGSGYLVAPLIYLQNPWPALGGGAYAPTATASTTGTGLAIPAGQTLTFNGAMMVPGSAVAINGFTTGNPFSVIVGGLT
jgi:hypothetical protein